MDRTPASMSIRAFALGLGLVALAALGLRVGYIAVAKAGAADACGRETCGDAFFYSTEAHANALGHWWKQPFALTKPAADHPPLTALVATPASWVTDDDWVIAQRVTMALVGTATVVVIGLIGRRLAGDRAGLLAAGLAAITPSLWINDGLIMAESLAALGTAACLLLGYRLIRAPSVAAAAWLGVAIGFSILTRAELVLLLPVVFLPVILTLRDLDVRRRLGRLVVVAAVAAVVVLPWTIYNTTRFEEPVLVSTNDGLTLIGANCDRTYRGPALGLWDQYCRAGIDATGDPSQVSSTYRRAGWDYIAGHLSRVPVVVAARIGRTWGLYEPGVMVQYNVGEGREPPVSWAGLWVFYAMLPASVAGAVILRRRGIRTWPLVGLAVMVTITVAVTYGLFRFRVPADVAMVVLSAVALDGLFRRFGRRDDGRARDVPGGVDAVSGSTSAS